MSSDDIVLSVKNISKRFEIYNKPRHRLQQMLFGRWKTYFQEFWALRDIDFTVKRGECVGVIGRNGAGKSTLLQIITGTLQPTSGTVERHGRIAALLELGSGFNPEFTGKENVYMNASILGLSKTETDAKYKDIVDFADIGDFIDQPVKTYSSGMMVRLAFAVQIMVDPDILIVDEALAVGDAAFQRKCFARLESLIAKGMTLFLVTHDTETVKRLCSRAIYLRSGKIVFNGNAVEGVSLYMKELFGAAEPKDAPKEENDPAAEETVCVSEKFTHGSGGAWFTELRVYGLQEGNRLPEKGPVRIHLGMGWNQEIIRQQIVETGVPGNLVVGYAIANSQNTRLFGTNTDLRGFKIDPFSSDTATVDFIVEFPILAVGEYFLVAAIHLGTNPGMTELIWHDFAIPLVSDKSVPGGFIDAPTKIEII